MNSVIQVDPAGLREVGRQLQRAAGELNRTSGRDFAADAGDPVIQAALLDVQHDWSKKRKVITEYLSDVGKAAQAAADAYAQVEAALAAGATVPGCPS